MYQLAQIPQRQSTDLVTVETASCEQMKAPLSVLENKYTSVFVLESLYEDLNKL